MRLLASRVVKALPVAGSSVTAIVALVVSVVALSFSLWPDLRPDPHDLLAAKVHVDTVEPDVTLAQYLHRTDQKPLKATLPSDLRKRGNVVYLRIQIQGRKHDKLELHQVLYRASTRQRIPKQEHECTLDSYFVADTPNDQWIYQVFVFDPPPGFPQVFVRLELYELLERDSLLAFADTPPLRARP